MGDRLLTVIRHGSAGAERGPRGDFDRALDERGRHEATQLGRWLLEIGHLPDRIVASGALRAAQTAEILAAELALGTGGLELIDDLYCAGVPTLIEAVRALDADIRHVALVGHNHGITDFCGWLCDAALPAIPTCGVVAVALAADTWSAVSPGCGARVDLGGPGGDRS